MRGVTGGRSTTFGPLEIAYDREVLEPRPWTLEQSRWAAELSPDLPDGPILELCCGAGQIGLVAALETGRPLVQVDDDRGACGYARTNADAAGVDADVRHAHFEEALQPDEWFPLVLADPPYVPSSATRQLREDPGHAIDGGADGLDVARSVLAVAAAHVRHDGVVLVQLGGEHQAATMTGHAATLGLGRPEVRAYGPDRTLLVLRPTAPN